MKQPTSLHVVLSLRARQQDAAERALSDALAALQAAQQLLNALQADLHQLKNCPAAKRGELLHMADLLYTAQRIQALERSCTEAEAVLSTRMASVAEQQAAYLVARREWEVVDALLKQRATQARERQTRLDIKLSDDLFLGRFNRRTEVDGTAV